MHSMITIVNDTVFFTGNLLREISGALTIPNKGTM